MNRNSKSEIRNSQQTPETSAFARELRITNYGLRKLSRALKITIATLREIFDENAYARFLARERTSTSRESYRAFQREMADRRERKARCC